MARTKSSTVSFISTAELVSNSLEDESPEGGNDQVKIEVDIVLLAQEEPDLEDFNGAES